MDTNVKGYPQTTQRAQNLIPDSPRPLAGSTYNQPRGEGTPLRTTVRGVTKPVAIMADNPPVLRITREGLIRE